jgi:hypothetical protein
VPSARVSGPKRPAKDADGRDCPIALRSIPQIRAYLVRQAFVTISLDSAYSLIVLTVSKLSEDGVERICWLDWSLVQCGTA